LTFLAAGEATGDSIFIGSPGMRSRRLRRRWYHASKGSTPTRSRHSGDDNRSLHLRSPTGPSGGHCLRTAVIVAADSPEVPLVQVEFHFSTADWTAGTRLDDARSTAQQNRQGIASDLAAGDVIQVAVARPRRVAMPSRARGADRNLEKFPPGCGLPRSTVFAHDPHADPVGPAGVSLPRDQQQRIGHERLAQSTCDDEGFASAQPDPLRLRPSPSNCRGHGGFR